MSGTPPTWDEPGVGYEIVLRRVGATGEATAIELGRYASLHELLAAIISLALARGWLQPRRIIVVR